MRKVLEILENDAKVTPEQISKITGVPVKEVEETIKKAEQDRTIVKYKTMINWSKVGVDQVWAMVEVKVVPQRNVGFDAIAERIYRFPQVRSMYLVSGTYDLAVMVLGNNMHDVAAFVTEKLAPLESVQGTATHFLLKKYKEDGEIFEGDTGVKRLPVTP